MIYGGKNGGESGQSASSGAEGLIPMNRWTQVDVQESGVPVKAGTITGQSGRSDTKWRTRVASEIS